MTAIMDSIKATGTPVAELSINARANPEDTARDIATLRDRNPETHVFFTPFTAGSVLTDGDNSRGAGHVNTWAYAYDIPAVRDWLLEQHR